MVQRKQFSSCRDLVHHMGVKNKYSKINCPYCSARERRLHKRTLLRHQPRRLWQKSTKKIDHQWSEPCIWVFEITHDFPISSTAPRTTDDLHKRRSILHKAAAVGRWARSGDKHLSTIRRRGLFSFITSGIAGVSDGSGTSFWGAKLLYSIAWVPAWNCDFSLDTGTMFSTCSTS